MVTGLVLLLMHATPSWGQPVCVAPGCNPTTSDGNFNTAGGTGALLSVVETASGGFNNTAFGENALSSNTTGGNNTASGVSALFSNTTGGNNTASGLRALFSNTTGINNTAFGVTALQNNTSGQSNTASGVGALAQNTTGFDNTATGLGALGRNTTGVANAATGFNALTNNTTGNNNTATGDQALFRNSTGANNTATGDQALFRNSTGANNTATGANALRNALGTKNIAIGYQAGVTLTNGNNNIYIGNQGAGDEFQTIRIGTAQAQTFIAGIGNASVTGATVEVDTTTGQLGIVTSSARYKQDIAPMGSRSEQVLELRPVTFSYKDDARKVTHYGLVAEEVAVVYPDLVTRTATGEVQTVKYQELIPMLLNELQRVRQELAELRAQGQRGATGETAALAR